MKQCHEHVAKLKTKLPWLSCFFRTPGEGQEEESQNQQGRDVGRCVQLRSLTTLMRLTLALFVLLLIFPPNRRRMHLECEMLGAPCPCSVLYRHCCTTSTPPSVPLSVLYQVLYVRSFQANWVGRTERFRKSGLSALQDLQPPSHPHPLGGRHQNIKTEDLGRRSNSKKPSLPKSLNIKDTHSEERPHKHIWVCLIGDSHSEF